MATPRRLVAMETTGWCYKCHKTKVWTKEILRSDMDGFTFTYTEETCSGCSEKKYKTIGRKKS